MISPQVVVPDVAAVAEYYRDVSGFRFLYSLDPPVFAIVARHCVEIQFGRADRETPPSPNWTGRQGRPDARIWVNDLDSLHKGMEAAERKDHRSALIDRLSVYSNGGRTISVSSCAFLVHMTSPANGDDPGPKLAYEVSTARVC